MNTLLLNDALRNTLPNFIPDTEEWRRWQTISESQDLHTKSLLADEVRVLIDKRIPYKKYLPFSADHTPEWDIYEAALQAVLKLIEAKE